MSTHWTFLALLTSGCASTPKTTQPLLRPGLNTLTISQEVNGETVPRRYLVHVADTWSASTPLPLLLAFHGNGGEGADFQQLLHQSVQSGAFIGVYPDGIERSWNLGREASTADDVVFVESILSALGDVDGIDASKPVAMGFSNGAGMVHKLAMESTGFVAIAPLSSQLLVSNQPQSDDPPVSVLQLHGVDDDIVPYAGGEAVMGHTFMTAEASAAAWAAHNRCNPTATETASGEHVRLEWKGCAAGAAVVHYRLSGVGHALPTDIEGDTIDLVVRFLLSARQ